MEISQLKAALEQAIATRNVTPDASLISAFNEKLAAGNVNPLPENTIVKTLQVKQAEMVQGMESSKAVSTLSPESALAVQYGLANSAVSVDLVAKVAGAFSQGINKLVAMQ